MDTQNYSVINSHEAVLSKLEWVQKSGDTIHYYPKEEFEKNITSFSQLPVIYAKKHPSHVRGRNLEEVLKEVDGELAGYTREAMINNMGSPKLTSFIDIINPKVENEIQNGNILISPGFWYTAPKVGSLQGISGDHVLLFNRDLGINQGDPAAMIYNQEQQEEPDLTKEQTYFGYSEGEFLKTNQKTGAKNMSENEMPASAIMQIVELLKTNQESSIKDIVEKESQILKLNQDLEKSASEVLKLNQELEAKELIITDQAKAIEDLNNTVQKMADEKLEAIINSYKISIPEPLKAEFEGRFDELKDLQSAIQLNQEVLVKALNIPKVELVKAEGDQTIKVNQEPAKPRPYNPRTGKME